MNSSLSLRGHGAKFEAELVGTGEVAVTATMIGQGAGLANANGLLITLQFAATNATSSVGYAFTPTNSRRAEVCPTAGQPCADEAGNLNWTGGALVVN